MSDFTEAQKQYLDQLFSQLATTYNQQTQEVKRQIGDLKKEVQVVIRKYDNKIRELEKQNENLENKFADLDRKLRKNNVIVFGLKKQGDIQEEVLKIINDSQDTQFTTNDINDIYCLGAKEKPETPVIIEFVSNLRKNIILNNSKKLKERGITVSQDQSVEDRRNTKILLKHRWEARQKGLKAQIRGQKLLIGTETYSVEQLEENFILDDINKRPNSAPTTPDPQQRQKRLFEELGITDETETQENKKNKQAVNSKVNVPRFLRSNSGSTEKF